MKILIINGPNLNMLGKRDPKKYGTKTWKEIFSCLCVLAQNWKCRLISFQSNCEGKIIDFLQSNKAKDADGVLINPGALTRYGYSLRQALIDFDRPVFEVHLSNIGKTGIAKNISVFRDIRIGLVTGLKEKSYIVGLKKLTEYLKLNNNRSYANKIELACHFERNRV